MQLPSPQSSTEQGRKKKRNRLTIVCRRCRVKKTQCDKQLPCSKCVKANCPDLCFYDSQRPRSEEKLAEMEGMIKENIDKQIMEHAIHKQADTLSSPVVTSVQMLAPSVLLEDNDFMIGVNPIVRLTDIINMHMDLSTLSSDHAAAMPFGPGSPLDAPVLRTSSTFKPFKSSTRPISFVQLSQQEPGARLFWKLADREEKLRLMTVQNFHAQQRNDVLKDARAVFGKQFISTDLAQSPDAAKAVSEYGQSLGLSFTEGYSDDDDFQVSLQKVLPHKLALLKYLERFFRKVYPVYPVLDEFWVYEQVDRLLKYSPSGETLEAVNIGNRNDLVILSVLLFTLRLAYLSYFTPVRETNETMLNTTNIGPVPMINAQINLSAVDLAYKLYAEGSYRRKLLFLLVQACLLKCINRMYAQANELAVYNVHADDSCGHVIQMALGLSMERDPDNMAGIEVSERQSNLRRKVWHVLVQLDYSMSYLLFSPRVIGYNCYNTKVPTFSAALSNIKDLELEALAVELICQINDALTAGSDLLDLCLNLQLPYKVMDVLEKLNDFELYIQEKLGNVTNYFTHQNHHNHNNRLKKLAKLRILLTLKLFLGNVYYFLHLYYNYKKVRDLDHFFLRKVLLLLYSELNFLSPELIFSRDPMFDSTFFMVLSPIVQLYLHMIAIIGLGMAIRLNCSIILMDRPGDPAGERLELMKVLARRNEYFVLRKLKLCKLFSERYFYSWKCIKTNAFGYKMISTNSLYMNNVSALDKVTISWTDRQLDEITRAVPEGVSLLPSNISDMQSHCYYSSSGIDDADLTGTDLLKTVQTDNFWFVLNAVTGTDPFAAPICLRFEDTADSTAVKMEDHERGDTRSSSDSVNVSSIETSLADNNSVSTPNDCVPLGGITQPNAFEILEHNLFSTDWSIDDFFTL